METIARQECIATNWQQCNDGAKYISREKCGCQKCFKEHGETMLEIGIAFGLQNALKYETLWSVEMDCKRWTLDTVLIDTDEPLTLISKGFNAEDFSDWMIKTTAKNGTVGELWKAAERAFKKANKNHGDWHRYIEDFDPIGVDTYEIFFGS